MSFWKVSQKAVRRWPPPGVDRTVRLRCSSGTVFLIGRLKVDAGPIVGNRTEDANSRGLVRSLVRALLEAPGTTWSPGLRVNVPTEEVIGLQREMRTRKKLVILAVLLIKKFPSFAWFLFRQ